MRPRDVFPGSAADQRLITNEGPTVTEVAILGAELAVGRPDSSAKIFIDVFACRHTLPYSPVFPREVYVILHTTRGPIELRGEIR